MKIKLMDSSAWIDTKKIIGFNEKEKEELNLKTKRVEKNIEYQVIVPGKTFLVSRANYFALMDIWRTE